MLSIPQPDFEPCLAFHLGAFPFPPEDAAALLAGDDEGDGCDVSDQASRARQLLMVCGDRR